MINTGKVRVKRAIAVPTMSAQRWEYVSGELADWLFEFIQNFYWSEHLSVDSLKKSLKTILAIFLLVSHVSGKNLLQFHNWHNLL
jgi:hypothetical protein